MAALGYTETCVMMANRWLVYEPLVDDRFAEATRKRSVGA